ncbi:MAG: aminodeoxychorismate synthase component I [Gaiellaceae bacterium]
MQTLLIDNYDSYTYNLFQLLAKMAGREPVVVRNDELSAEEIERMSPGAIVISPGPGTPEHAGDLGVARELVRGSERPILGVCLGHQAIGFAWGARVAPAPQIVHGGTSRIRHDGSALFAGIPQGFRAVRYHSLAVEDVSSPLVASAWTDEGVVMALRHETLPQWGVQFHPESILSEHGETLVANFLELARECSTRISIPRRARARRPAPTRRDSGFRLLTRRLDWLCEPEQAFAGLFLSSPEAFWLDADLEEPSRSRFSFMGDASGPLAQVVSYDVGERCLLVRSAGEPERTLSESIFDYIERELARLRLKAPELPFDFACGFAGYFGYELGAETGGGPAHRSPYPDAAFVLADRLIAFDRVERAIWLVELVGGNGEPGGWLDETEVRLRALEPLQRVADLEANAPLFRADLEPGDYLDAIAACKRQLELGESYEICLTTQLRAERALDPFELYRVLRRINPAPHSAYLRFGDLAVLSSSPERFLRLDRGRRLETKPIKGTAPRSADPAEDERIAASLCADAKNRAENLMIADLMRNDLGRVCEVGSVEVPALMQVESYAGAHQLVTTVAARLREDLIAIDAVRAAFPPGSMTGAPKIRTMQIIDRLEPAARGIYSGCLGFLSLSGCADLSVVIRTIVASGEELSIGSGGAITILSDAGEELAELVVKAEPLLQAIAVAALQSGGDADVARQSAGACSI